MCVFDRDRAFGSPPNCVLLSIYSVGAIPGLRPGPGSISGRFARPPTEPALRAVSAHAGDDPFAGQAGAPEPFADKALEAVLRVLPEPGRETGCRAARIQPATVSTRTARESAYGTRCQRESPPHKSRQIKGVGQGSRLQAAGFQKPGLGSRPVSSPHPFLKGAFP